MAVCGSMACKSPTACTYWIPFVSSVGTSVPEQHPSMTATLEHLKSHSVPTPAEGPGGLRVAPTVQAIVVDSVTVVEPQLAPIIRDNAESVMATPEDSHLTCPTNGEVVTSRKTWPPAPSVAVVHHLTPASHVRLTSIEVRAPPSLTKVKDILPEETTAVCGISVGMPQATGTHNSPSVCGVRTLVPEHHTGMTTTFEHLNSYDAPPSTEMSGGLAVALSMQPIIVDCVTIVNPQLAPIIGDNAQPVMTCLVDSHTTCPPHGKVIASRETRPPLPCIAIVNHLAPSCHVRSATVQVLATVTLAKVEGILSEDAVAISGAIAT